MNNWSSTTLGQIVSLDSGVLQTGPFGSQLHKSDYVVSGIPCVMPANIQGIGIDLDGIAMISEKDANRLGKHLVKSGDIIFSRRGDITKKALIRDEQEGYFCGTGCILVRTGESINSEFLIYYLSSPESASWIVKKAVGITMPNINTKILSDYPIKLPCIAEQKAIAKVLSDLDAKIELNNKINAELEAMAKLIYDYWFVQFDFPNEDGKPYKSSGGTMVYNEELKREIPEGWEVKELGKYAKIKKGTLITEKTANTNGNIKVVSAGIGYSYCHTVSNYSANTITISASGANAGFINFWHEPIFACDCTTVRGSTDADTLFVLEFLKIRQDYIYQQARGSAQPHVYPKDIEALFIELPKEELIEAFGKKIIAGNQVIANNKKLNQQLASLRDWLLPMLMNGQVTIRQAHGSAVKEAEEQLSELGMVAEPRGEYKTKK